MPKIIHLHERPLNTFDDVAAAYWSIKPINGNAKRDIRPLGLRRRKSERVERVDENTYVLHDGAEGCTVWHNQPDPSQIAYERAIAPIVWERRADGDYVRIRNGNVDHASVSRPAFFYSAMPRGMAFNQSSRPHEVHYTTRLTRCVASLPKTTLRYDYNTDKMVDDDGVMLWFKSTGDGTWERVGDLVPVKTKRVDKDEKAKWWPAIEAFYAWLCAVAPVMDFTYDSRNDARERLYEYAKWMDPTIRLGSWRFHLETMPASMAREIIADPEHDLRIYLAVLVAEKVGMNTLRTNSPDEPRLIRSRFNVVMNKLLAFHKTEML